MKGIHQQEGKAYIYGLLDPFTMELRYVGRARDPIQRLKGHLNETYSGVTKGEWIKECLLKGRRPILAILDTADDSSIKDIEKQWIRLCELNGCKLTNQRECSVYQGNLDNRTLSGNADTTLHVLNTVLSQNWKYQELVLHHFTLHHCLRIANGEG